MSRITIAVIRNGDADDVDDDDERSWKWRRADYGGGIPSIRHVASSKRWQMRRRWWQRVASCGEPRSAMYHSPPHSTGKEVSVWRVTRVWDLSGEILLPAKKYLLRHLPTRLTADDRIMQLRRRRRRETTSSSVVGHHRGHLASRMGVSVFWGSFYVSHRAFWFVTAPKPVMRTTAAKHLLSSQNEYQKPVVNDNSNSPSPQPRHRIS